MRKKVSILWIILTSAVMLTLGSAVLASDVSGALYQGNIDITNAGSAGTNVAVNFSLSTQSLIDDDYIVTNCSNTAIVAGTSDTAYMPAPGSTSNWIVFVPSIGDNSTLLDKLYTGGGDMSGKLRYFPGTEGMATADNTSLELGFDFETEQKGWVDTSSGSDKNLVYKMTSYKVYVNEASSVRAAILSGTWASPTGFVDPEADWVNEADAYDDNTGSQASDENVVTGTWTEELWLTIDSTAAYGARYYLYSFQAGDKVDLDAYYDTAWHDVYEGTYASDTWETKVFSDGEVHDITQVRIRMYNAHAATKTLLCREVDLATETEDAAVTATGVSSGEHTIKTEVGVCFDDGDALHFDGTATSNVNAGVLHDAETKLWVSFWFRLDNDFTPASPPTSQYLWAKYVDATHYLMMWLNDGSAKLKFRNRDGEVNFTIDSVQATWNAGQWYHVIGSVSSVNGARLIIDGGTALTDADTTAILTGGDFIFGDQDDPGGGTGFEGHIANFIVGTDDLSTAEEAALYDGSAPGDAVNFWYADEGTGTTITDYGTGGDDGTADTACSWATISRPFDFFLEIDGSIEDATNLYGTSVPDTAFDWTFLQNDVMLYMESHKLTASGTLQQHIIWVNDSSTFTDQSGEDHDATPTFRTTSSDAEVSAELVSFLPIEEAEATSYVLEETASILSAAPDEIPHMYTELQTNHLPGAELINDALDAADIPQELFWFPFSFGIAIIAGFMAYRVTSGKGSTQGSLLMQAIVSGVVLAFFSLMTGGGVTGGVVPFWPVFIFAIEAFAVMIWSKQVTV